MLAPPEPLAQVRAPQVPLARVRVAQAVWAPRERARVPQVQGPVLRARVLLVLLVLLVRALQALLMLVPQGRPRGQRMWLRARERRGARVRV